MWQYNQTNELAHHGVKGMRWGVRRKISPLGAAVVKTVAKGHLGVAKLQRKAADKIGDEASSIESQKNKMLSLKTKSGKKLFTEKDIKDMVSGLRLEAYKKSSKASAHEKMAKQLLSEIKTLTMKEVKAKINS
jgi:hypothetical protein